MGQFIFRDTDTGIYDINIRCILSAGADQWKFCPGRRVFNGIVQNIKDQPLKLIFVSEISTVWALLN